MIVSESWDKILQKQFQEPYIWEISKIIKRDAAILCPKPADIWNALKACSFEQTKVIILGMDPYINGEAHGLAFSSQLGITPSLRVIFKELQREFNVKRENPNLTDWAEQGVLLLNSSLTTVRGQTGAHQNIGWERLTGAIIGILARRKTPTVMMAWGKQAKDLVDKNFIPNMNGSDHLILKAIHPQAENYGDGTYTFTGCGHFRKANDFLGEHRRGRIKWV